MVRSLLAETMYFSSCSTQLTASLKLQELQFSALINDKPCHTMFSGSQVYALGFWFPPLKFLSLFTTYFFKASGIIRNIFVQNYFFPLKKSKILRIFSQNRFSEGVGPPPPPTPPHQGEKFFFAFLDELDHFMNKNKSVFLTFDFYFDPFP